MNRTIQEALHDFCKSINGGSPIAVRYEPEAWAKIDHCFANVKREVEESGGAGRLGWQFGQIPVGTTPGVIIAFHHEVWTSPAGELIDITPCVQSILKSDGGIFFLPDDAATLPRPLGFEVGVSRPGKFYPLANTAKVRKMIEAARLNERQYWEEVMGC